MYPSTHALSAYNALRLSGDGMTAEQILEYAENVCEYRDASLGDIALGIEFLLERRFVTVAEGRVRATRKTPKGVPWPLVRTDEDRELRYR